MEYSSCSHRQAEEILNSGRHKHTLKEIKSIISNLKLDLEERGNHERIKVAFKSNNWITEESISEGLKKKWRYDAFKDKVAVEIDTGTPCYRSFLKFILGYNQGKIDVGVIIVYDMRHSRRPEYRRFATTEKELEDLFSIVPVPILVIGIHS